MGVRNSKKMDLTKYGLMKSVDQFILKAIYCVFSRQKYFSCKIF